MKSSNKNATSQIQTEAKKNSNEQSHKPIFLKDYTPPSHIIKNIKLTFDLDDQTTIVTSQMNVERNPQHPFQGSTTPLTLNGEKIKLLSIKLNGQQLKPDEYSLDDKFLTLHNTPEKFNLEIVNETYPEANTALDGLYKSLDMICTQNEPEGFRKITYYLDRPDVMSKYITKIIANKKKYPILLSNGNEVGKGDLPDGKHWVEWEDPFNKPAYLFALVAGDLGLIESVYTTASKKEVALKIYCDKGNESKCQYAMESLIRAMKWDEETFNLEYDLNIYMIVVVQAFNMGAMENKGLNIFNTSAALADPESATDANYSRVERVIGHEYFHNWTGNRVTCRDWFQLTLKEGLTVFRDQEFFCDMNSRPVHRIECVTDLRNRQFPEDAGPTSHPIQPQSYLQINNFYTATIYNKGAEVIRMIQTLIGKEAFKKGMAKYIEMNDGKAATTEDFVKAMEIASGADLKQFRRWYNQAGTPEVQIRYAHDKQNNAFTITVQQFCKSSASNHSPKEPFHFPLTIGLLNREGKEIPLELSGHRKAKHGLVLNISQAKETFIFPNISEHPVLSVNRNFSAPIKIHVPYHHQDYIFLMKYDTDLFNRWEAGQELASSILLSLVLDLEKGQTLKLNKDYIDAFGMILKDDTLDNAIKAESLTLPNENNLGQRMDIIDFDRIHIAREFMLKELANIYYEEFKHLYHNLHSSEKGEFKVDAKSKGERSLKNLCLYYLSLTQNREAISLCDQQFKNAKYMTDSFGALSCLSHIDCNERDEALKTFYSKWKNDLLTMNKWFAVQALSKTKGTLNKVKALLNDPIFDIKIPNLVRALLGSFTENHVHFHVSTGEGYLFLADQIIIIDKLNPQIAAKLAGAFEKYPKLDHVRKKAMKTQMERILSNKVSNNTYEIVSKCLGIEK